MNSEVVYGSRILSTSEVCVVDYGLGNLRSIQNALVALNVRFRFVSDADEVAAAHSLILPGVGAYRAGMESLNNTGLAAALRNAVDDGGASVLGICLGMQLLLDEGNEGGWTEGLGLIPGAVQRFESANGLRVPHMGFNEVSIEKPSILFRGIPDCGDFYFLHSFHAIVADTRHVLATTFYGAQFASVIGKGKVFGVQFHPEKSQNQGLRMLKNFCEL